MASPNPECETCGKLSFLIYGRELRKVMLEVARERTKQDAKWGEQNHNGYTYLAILMEEVGEAAKAALHDQFGGKEAGGLRTELVQTAAVAVAMIECLDRKDKRRRAGLCPFCGTKPQAVCPTCPRGQPCEVPA